MAGTLIVIPARLGSTRLPRKVILDETGKYLVQHVYERALALPGEVVIATDHADVFEACRSFGGNVVMTSPDHPSGSDRATAGPRCRIEPTPRGRCLHAPPNTPARLARAHRFRRLAARCTSAAIAEPSTPTR